VSNDPNQYDDLFQSAGQQYNVDPQLLKTIYQVESNSGGNTNRSLPNDPDSPVGGMQLRPSTGKAMGAADVTQMSQAVPAAAKYLSQGLDTIGSPEGAAAYYFGGPDMQGWRGKTQAYVNKVKAIYPGVKVSASIDPDIAAGEALLHDAPSSANTATDPDIAAGQALLGDTKPTPTPAPTAMPAPGQANPVVVGNVAPTGFPVVDNALSGGIQGVKDVVSTGANLAKWVDSKVPALARLDENYGTTPNVLAGRLDADRQAYDASAAGQSLAGTGGRLVGNLLASAPIVGPVGDAVGVGVGAVGSVLPNAGAIGNFLGRAAGRAVQGGVGGGVFGAATSGGSDQPVGDSITSGAKAGAVLGPALGVVGDAAGAAIGRVSPEVAQLAKLARDQYGIPLSAPQISTNSMVKIASDQLGKMPFSGAAPAQAATQKAWQKAVISQMGENADTASPQVMSRAASRIGQVFDDVASRTNVKVDTPMLNDLAIVEANARKSPLGSEGQSAIKAQIDNVMDTAAKGNGTITGDAYQQLTHAGSPLQRAEQAGDPNVRFYAGQVRDALDSAFQRSAASGDQAALTQARSQYRSMKTIEDMAEKSPDGNLSPSLLMGAVRSQSSKFDGSTSGMAYTGGGPLGDLARIGQQFLKPQPNSGTADRLLANSLVGNGAGLAAFAHPIGAVAGLTANRLAGSILRSGPVANKLISRSIP
jgi:hypothetical protein